MSRAATDDRELVQRVQAGDQEAFTVLVQRYQKRAFAVALGMLHDPDAALDVVQDAFIKVHKHIGSFQGNASFYTWLYRIVANLCIDVRRKRSRRPEVEFEERVVLSGAAVGVDVSPKLMDVDPARNLERQELGQQLELALRSLSEKHRLILLLREVEGLSYEEIAGVLKISKGTVMSRLFHARRNMQQALLPYLENDRGVGREAADERPDLGSGTQSARVPGA